MAGAGSETEEETMTMEPRQFYAQELLAASFCLSTG